MRPRELSRWAWRQLTSMRTALILLFLLALAAVPGSIVPQESVDVFRTIRWQTEHPKLTPIYEKLGLFSVYDSAWFSAIYILLMVSLVGCIVPRLLNYWRGLRARPPATPRNLSRLPQHRSYESEEDPEVVLDRARALLRRKHFRVATSSTTGKGSTTRDGSDSVSAERGYLREAGNLLFHLSVLIVLVGVAVGGLWGFKGGVIVVTGDGFANTLSQYDDFQAGAFFDPNSLEPFDFTLDGFDVTFIQEGREAGMAFKFAADLTYRTNPEAPQRNKTIVVNKPLSVEDTKVFLIGHGYAPVITVRNADGTVAYSGPVVFLPQDSTFLSFGVIKVPDAEQDGKDTQIGFEGEFYPTYGFTKAGGPFSAFPEDKNPAISMLAYRGDLGLDSGLPQSIYSIEKKKVDPIRTADGKPLRIDLAMNRTAQLPDGLGTISFDGMNKFVKLQISRTPGQTVTLTGTVLALLGLLGSLFIRPRRVWVRARREGGHTVVEVAGLDRGSGRDLSGEIESLAISLRGREAEPTPVKEST